MKTFTPLLVWLTIAVPAFSETHKVQEYVPSQFEVIATNSPVKGPVAKFFLKLPPGFEVDKIKVKLVKAHDFKKEQKKFEDVEVNDNELQIGVSKLPPGFYRLFVKVIDKKFKKEHDFKKKHHDFVRFVIDESMQVPMPDPKKNNATIGGVDSDNNGIRDDIQRDINETYSNEPKTKMALKQIATFIQAALLNHQNKELSIAATANHLRSIDCLSYITVDLRKARQMMSKIEGKFFNTKERHYAHIEASANFNGQTTQLPNGEEEDKSTCDFDVDQK